MIKIKVIVSTAIIIFSTTLYFSNVESSYAGAKKRALLIIFDGITLNDIKKSQPPNLLRLIEEGAIGLMNTRSGRTGDIASGYLTIGTGAWAVARRGRTEGGLAFKEDSLFEGRKVSDIYRQQTGSKPPPSSIVVVTAPLIVRENMEEDYGAEPGSLAEAMKKNGKKVAVLGNADNFGQFHREAALIAMDRNGLIEEGEVGKQVLRENSEAPYGIQTNYEELLEKTKEFLKKNDLIVIETGDTSRINRYQDFLSKDVLEKERQKVLLKGDQFVGEVLKQLPSNSLLIVVSPNPATFYEMGVGAFTPIIVYSQGIKKGLLTSPTTRQLGLVANTDIAPTILNYFGIKTDGHLVGRPISAKQSRVSLDYLLEREKKIMETANFRKPILTAYVAAVFVLLVLAGLSLFYPVEPRMLRTIHFLLAWQLSVPLSLLLLSPMTTGSLSITALLIICSSVLITFLAWISSKKFLLTTGLIAIATATAIVLDLLLGGNLTKNSLLGYDPLIGARFYGIGNEYMGVLVGSALAGGTILQDTYFSSSQRARKLMLILFLLIAAAIGYPRLGANIGGAIAAAGAFFLTFLRMEGKRIDVKNILLTALVVGVVVFLAVGIDFLAGLPNQSHAGRAALFIKKEGYQGAAMIVKRKIATNLKLIRWTIWSKVFIASLAIFALLFSQPVGLLKKAMQKHPRAADGVFGIVAGSIIALLFNDSGIVAAATMIIFGVVTLLYFGVE